MHLLDMKSRPKVPRVFEAAAMQMRHMTEHPKGLSPKIHLRYMDRANCCRSQQSYCTFYLWYQTTIRHQRAAMFERSVQPQYLTIVGARADMVLMIGDNGRQEYLPWLITTLSLIWT